MTPPPHKKHRSSPLGSAPDATSPLQLSLFRLLSHLSLLSTHLTPVPVSPLPILADLETLRASTQAFKDSLASSDEEEVRVLRVGKSKGGWKDEIDAKGTLLWNKSTAIKVAVVPGSGEEEGWNKVVAMLRHLGFNLISIGSLEPPTVETLLSLANKASLAFLSLSPPDFPTSDSLLSIAATHAEAIPFPPPPTTPGAPTTEGTKVLLAHYCARVMASVRSGNMPIAKWMMGKAKELSDGGRLGGREVEKLAQMACDVGAGLVRPLRESAEAGKTEDQGARAAAAVEWLLWATQLLEVRDSGTAKMLQIATLKSLAQAYLDATPARSGWTNAESTLAELLVLEPSTTLWRREIKLIVARKGGDGEIVEAFTNAASTMPWSEIEGSRLVGEIHRLPDDRRLLRFTVIDALLDVGLARLGASSSEPTSTSTETSDIGTGPQAFITQILTTAVFLVTDKDKQRLVDLFDKITLSQPSFELTSSAAFVCTTYVWRQGDKAHREKQFETAAEWYLLGANSTMRAIEKTAWAKTFRKAALCYSEVGLYDRAEQVMDRSLGTDLAKSHFVRFYISTLKKDEARAIDALRFLVTAPDFTLNMLFWAARTAHESSLKNLLGAVLSSLLRVCKGDSIVAVDIDMLTLSRCLIRLLVSRLEEDRVDQTETATALLHHFETALELGTSLSSKPAISSTLAKNVAWLHRTGYNLCVRHADKWESLILVELYAIVASLMELDSKLTPVPDPETFSKLWLCRFAALSGRVMSARTTNSRRHKVEAYKALLPGVNALRTSLAKARAQTPRIDRVELIESAVLALEVEALSETGDWQAIVHLVEAFDQSDQELPVEIIKAITERATSAHDCPPDAVCSILKRTLNVLHARNDLKIPSLSSWLRTIITVILARDGGDEALRYFKAALDVLKIHGAAAYPPDEIHWLIATAWDQGIDRFSGHNLDKGHEFCDFALEISKLSDPLLAEKLGGMLEELEEQYPMEREGGEL